MFESIAIRLFGFRKAGWANLYERDDGTKMTGGMLYSSKKEAIEKGCLSSAKSKYIGTKKFYY